MNNKRSVNKVNKVKITKVKNNTFVNNEYFLIEVINFKKCSSKRKEYIIIDKTICKGLRKAKKWFDVSIKKGKEYIIVKSEAWF